MTRESAIYRLLVLLLIAASLGCQSTRGAQQGSIMSPQEQTVQEGTTTEKAEVPATAAPAGGQAAPARQAEAAVTLKDQKDKASYMVGLDLGRDLRTQELGLNVEPLLQGLRDSLQGTKPLLAESELEEVKQAFVKERLAARAKAVGAEAEKNFREGEAFLAANGKKEGVKTLPSGLQYKVLASGDGASPSPTDNVKAHYVVKSLEGKELDSTRKADGPAVFPVNGVIPAWTEALQLMKVGDKWEIYAPSYMAYGEKGVGSVVGPFQTLIFEIELLGIH